ncbi:MAG: cohesin domain-containing protein [Bacteroidetes bacterium]|nr:cohesin domain-containing protein [Bacteroidota bacterium]
MMRKFTFTLLMVLVFGSLSFGQYTAMLQTVTASPNENVSVNLTVTGFSSINSFQFYIQVDPAVLTFQNVTNFLPAQQANMTVGASGGNVITIVWTNPTPTSFAPGTLLTLNFKYNGLTSPIAFQPSNCEVAKLVGVTPVVLTGTFTDGAISPVTSNTAQANIGHITAPLGTVVVPVTYTGFPTNVGSITQRISYDPTKLTYISTTGTGNLTGSTAALSAGVVIITWTNPLGKDINTSQFNLNFSYTTLATTNVNFSTGCVITTTTPVTNIPVTYNNGSVAPGVPITAFASMPAITTGVQGQVVDVPLTFTGMPAGTNNFDIKLVYDNPRMSFIGVFNPLYPITTYASGSNINIVYTGAAPSINGQFLVLRFMYNGVGTANINFANGTQFSNGSPVSVGYTNGSVSPAPAIVNANIAFVNATSPSSVAVPVTFNNIPVGTEIGAVTMNIGFDATKLTYVNASNPHGATIQLTGNILHIAWSNTLPTIVNGSAFVTLNFLYSASGNATTQIIFKDGCQLANMAGTIVPANWNYGGINVNLQYTISGHLEYNSAPLANGPIAGATIYIKDGPEPVPPAVAPVPNVIATTTTDASGFYTVNVLNGTYYIYASSTGVWTGVDQGDVINLRRYIAGLTSTIDPPNGGPLRVRAADINQDGAVDNGDVIPLRRRIAGLTPNANYLAPDWLFENPAIIVNNANLPGTNFLGIVSGDVNGTYPY